MRILLSLIFFLALPDHSFGQIRAYEEFPDSVLNSLRDTVYTDTSDVALNDSIAAIAAAESLVPIFQKPFLLTGTGYAGTVSKKEIDRLDYRYLGDVFSYMRTGFLQDFGTAGHPGELYLYGYGYGNVSYLADGIPLNNRIHNGLDLNSLQSEYIDSLEIMPLPSGFIYDNYNNPVSVNFLMRDSISRTPVSRLRYYQGADDEGFIDALFSAYLGRRINGSFQVTHSGIDSRYQASESSLWKASAKIRYMPNNYLNIVGSYSYFDSNVDLNGGVDIDSIRNNVDPAEVDEVLYSNFQAPVNYISRYQKVTSHLYSLKMLGKIIDTAPSEIDLFYTRNVTQFRQNEYYDFGTQADIPVIAHDNIYKTYGGKFRQLFLFDPLKADFVSRYERSELDAPVLKYDDKITTYSFAGRAEVELLGGLLRPAVFGKYLFHSERSYSGYGAELTVRILDRISIYGGGSRFQKPYSSVEDQYLHPSVTPTNENLNVFEIGIRINSKLLRGSLSYFGVSNDNRIYPVIDLYTDTLKINEVGSFKGSSVGNHGINLNFDLHFWKVLLSLNASYYNYKLEGADRTLPDISAFTGLYYVDTLFNDNLKLKTGLNFRYIGKQNYSTYDFEKSRRVFHQYDPVKQEFGLIRNETTEAGYQLDFFLAGLVQDRAMVYFLYQNILGTDYYIVPYYPKQYRGIRIGIAWTFLD